MTATPWTQTDRHDGRQGPVVSGVMRPALFRHSQTSQEEEETALGFYHIMWVLCRPPVDFGRVVSERTRAGAVGGVGNAC